MKHGKTRVLMIVGVALLAAASTTMAEVQLQGTSMNGSNLQGTSMNGSNLQGVTVNGTNLQGVTVNGSNHQGYSPNGSNVQATSSNTAQRSRPAAASTGVKVRAVHVVGGQLFTGDAPARTPRND